MRRSLIAVSLLTSVALVGASYAKPAPKAKPAASKKAVASKTKAGPKIGTFGFDVAGMDRSVKPGNDFAAYAGGTWDKNTQIPADRATWGMFNVLQDVSTEQTRTILDEASKTPGSKIGDFYASFMDEAAINAKGVDPVKPWLAQIDGAKDKTALAVEMAKLTRYGIGGIFGMGVGQDSKDPQTYVVNLGQGGLGLPDRDYYLKDDPKLADTREKYKTYLATMLGFLGTPDAATRANAIFDFEKSIAQVHWTRIESRDADKRYNKLTFADIEAKAPGFPWAAYVAQNGMGGRPYYLVGQPSAIAGEAKVFADTPLPVLQDYMKLRVLRAYANYLAKPIVDANFAFTGTVLSGTPQQQIRWKRGVAATSGALGEEIGKVYVARYFPPESKAAIDQLVKNIIAAMSVRLDKLEWMAPETKVKAHEKLAAFTPKIGYPTKWRDYSSVKITRDSVVANVAAANEFEYLRNLNKLDKPIDRTEWGMTPMTINAYANPVLNEIVFPAAILQAPFFDPKADPAVNYGGIGVVIGHELSHHFDDQGRKYDKTGKLTEWWTAEDVKRFTALTDKLVKQYDAYEPIPGQHIQGGLTLGENMADLAGLAVAYDAYHKSLGGKPAPVIDGMTGDQRFFLGYAQVWRAKFREPALRSQLLSDPHSPGPFRTAEVRNVDAWYAAFGAQPGDALYLAPGDRVRVW
ncbi:M13 family metallopeptidase [Sphingomonas sp. MMS24-J45]|uniref:M13 family metallopeptidase n=1 Tax=Sphingomonas sp. MMS24-J45 TaxID=3238806 RepID=UPI00384F7A11